MHKRKMKISILVFISILVIAIWLMGPVMQASAEDMKYRVSSYITKYEALPVGDVEGHFVILYSRGGLAYFENGEVATIQNFCTADSIKGKGTVHCYSMVTFAGGSTIVGKFEGTIEDHKGTGEYIKGTGRFEGIKGRFTYTGKSLTPYSKEKGTMGDYYYDVISTHTLPSK
jgi:hypothetical protein